MGKSGLVTFENVRNVYGKRISLMRDPNWKSIAVVRTRVPTSNYLFNFDVHTSDGRTLLVLDPYGDEHLPEDIRRELGISPEISRETIGIWRDTGQIVHIVFAHEKKKVSLNFWFFQEPYDFVVPENFRARLDDLMSMKRPYSLGLPSHAWSELHARRIGYNSLYSLLVVSLHFGGDIGYLEVGKDGHRCVSEWE